MQSVVVRKTELLETLQSNLTKHVAEYDDAKAKYPSVVVAEFRKRADAVENGEEVDIYFNLPKPRSYAAEYEDAIQMLEWSVEEEIELEAHEFKQFVQDEWDWQGQFAASTQIYNKR